MNNRITRNPVFDPQRARPIPYFLCQIDDLFKQAAPNMSDEDKDVLLKLQQSILQSDTYFMEVAKEQAENEVKEAEKKKDVVVAKLCKVGEEMLKATGQEKDGQEKSDELIKLKHEIIQRMRDVVSLNDKYTAEQVIAAKNELLAIRNEKKQELLEELELIDLKYVVDSLRLDMAAKDIKIDEDGKPMN
ncbi:unnamed protein product [Caenorhabditis nigoni]|uniref:Uncharacterized protein n=1 Tax=Caenorhabditis nigoni TaxID=1611254 RepID=A0A2G5TDY8_9PELO|nr:hypothetical protein B9Z55_018441 [Caenorhabditis nigoni]